jgi:ribosome maturation factor RimP
MPFESRSTAKSGYIPLFLLGGWVTKEAEKARIADQVYDLLLPLAEARGLKAVDVEWVNEGGNWILRAFLDKEGGVSHQDCMEISRSLGEALEEVIPEAYVLEVSSPGLERVLKSERDFRYFRGRKVLVKTSPPFEKQRDWLGELGEVDPEGIALSVSGKEIIIPRQQIARVRLSLD